MNESDLRDLERRLSASLHALAPHAGGPDLADRMLRRTAALQQRRGFFGMSLSAALAAAAVVVLAVAMGLGIGYLLPRSAFVGGPSESPMPSAVPAPTPTASPSATVEPTTAPSAEPASKECTNDEIGYTVQYPSDWWANERVVPDAAGLTPIAGCVAFAEAPIELVPNSELPPDVAISAGLTEPPAGNPTQPVELLDGRELEVAGRPATMSEMQWTEDAIFFRSGDRVYEYRIHLPSGEILQFTTRTNDVIDHAAYEGYKAVLDAMMQTLELASS